MERDSRMDFSPERDEEKLRQENVVIGVDLDCTRRTLGVQTQAVLDGEREALLDPPLRRTRFVGGAPPA
jgi:hypothetical protein